MEDQRKETEILKKEISELRQRMLGSNTPIEPESLPPSSIGRILGTLGSKFKSLTNYKNLN
jgi:hypothetical protein